MTEAENLQEQSHYKELLIKYAHAYNLKKNKTKVERQLSNEKRLYVIYARKSTEDDKRQVQSVENQIEQCQKYAKNNDLEVVDIIREEKSAKIAGKRTQFDSMIKKLYEGNLYNSILAWHPDRLSRNMKESGEILDMLDNDIIADLKFPSYAFNNDAAGKMTLSILFAMAKEFSDKLSEDTRRGISKKVSSGKYTGTSKKGYYTNESGYFRPDDEKFPIYTKAWEYYKEGKTQSEIKDFLNDNDEDITVNAMSLYFQDPFAAGIYCYGDQVVDLNLVDPKFKPIVSPKDFILQQRFSEMNKVRWHTSSEFRPFNDFVICKDCGNFMVSGLSRSKSGLRYLNVTCGNRKCKEKRKEQNIKPIANTIRGETIKEFVIEGIKRMSAVDKATYEKAKSSFLEEKNSLIKSTNHEIRILRTKYAKLETKSKSISDKFLEVKNEDINKKLTNDLSIILKEMRTLEKDIGNLELKVSEVDFEIEAEFPDYNTFLNFFKDITGTIETSDNAYLIDQLVKLVFLNTVAEDKNIVGFELQEAFGSYTALLSHMG